MNGIKGYVMNKATGMMYGLNATGLKVVKLYITGKEREEIIDTLSKDAGITKQAEVTDFRRAIVNFLQSLMSKGFLRENTRVIDALDTSLPPILTAQLDLSWECNLKCRHCYLGENKKLVSESLSREEWKNLIIQLRDLGVPKIAFLGGEPLLSQHLFELARFARENDFLIYTTTNGTLITSEICKKFLDCGFEEIDVSLDGASAKTHDFLRGKGTFPRTIKGIKNLIASGLKVKSSTVVSKINLSEISQLILLGRELGISRMYFNALLPGGSGSALAQYALTLDNWIYIKSIIAAWNKQRRRPKTFGENYFLFEEATTASDPNSCQYAGCKAGKREIIITPDGFVAACPMLSTDRAYHTMNVRDYSLLEIWRNDPWITKLRAVSEINLTGKCVECEFKPICKGGCHILSLWEKGALNAPDPRCPY